MNVKAYDVYVKAANSETIHFRVLIKEGINEAQVIKAANSYLAKTPHETISANSCKYQHIRKATSKEEKKIESKGFWIMKQSQNCP